MESGICLFYQILQDGPKKWPENISRNMNDYFVNTFKIKSEIKSLILISWEICFMKYKGLVTWIWVFLNYFYLTLPTIWEKNVTDMFLTQFYDFCSKLAWTLMQRGDISSTGLQMMESFWDFFKRKGSSEQIKKVSL